MQTTMVTQSCKTIRSLARQTLRGKWIEAILIYLLYYAIAKLPTMLLTYFFDSDILYTLCNIYDIIIGATLISGLSAYFLKLTRFEDPGVETLLNSFSYWKKATLLYISMYIRIILGLFLFVIPGILAALKYSLSFFVLADNPMYTSNQCLAESAMLMNGNKTKLFFLHLSFIGWFIVASIPSSIIEFLFGNTQALDVSTMTSFDDAFNAAMTYQPQLASILAAACSFFVVIYVSCADAAFYDIASGRIRFTQE